MELPFHNLRRCWLVVLSQRTDQFAVGLVSRLIRRHHVVQRVIRRCPDDGKKHRSFLLGSRIPVGDKKCSSRSIYCGQSSLLPSNSSMRPNLPAISKWRERHLDFYALQPVGVTRKVISTAFTFTMYQSDLRSIVRLLPLAQTAHCD